MALTNISLLPHSPLLIPEIGRANFDFLAKTTAAYEQIGERLKTNGVDTVIIISPHGPAQEDTFILNIAPEMAIDFKDFGFIPPKTVLSGDAYLADQIKNALRSEFSLQLISENLLDHGSAIPLYLLKKYLPNAKILVVLPASGLSLEKQFAFGRKLEEVIMRSDKNIALIVSGDLSHRLKKKSPGGYSPKGAKFDNKLIEYLSDAASAGENIIKMDAKLVSGAGECGLKPIVIALGVLDQNKWQPEILAYQTDFGIGYLSLDFRLSSDGQPKKGSIN